MTSSRRSEPLQPRCSLCNDPVPHGMWKGKIKNTKRIRTCDACRKVQKRRHREQTKQKAVVRATRPDAVCRGCGVERPQFGCANYPRFCGVCAKEGKKRSGPLADPEWRRAALHAVEAWEAFGREHFTWAQWTGRFDPENGRLNALRQFERIKAAWRRLLGLELPAFVAGEGESSYQFTDDDVDRLLLIRDLLDRYLVWRTECPRTGTHTPEPADAEDAVPLPLPPTTTSPTSSPSSSSEPES